MKKPILKIFVLVFMAVMFTACSGFLTDFSSRPSSGGPTTVLLIILLTISLTTCCIITYYQRERIFEDFDGYYLSNGMKPIWVYNIEPYLKIGYILLIAVASFLATLTVMFLVGAIVWGVFWLIKILLLIIIIVGWVALIGGCILVGIGIFGGEGGELVVLGIISAIIGGIIVWARDGIRDVGERLVNAGFEFMNTLNLFNWVFNLFKYYWDVILLCILFPALFFLAIAATIIILNGILIGVEMIVMKIYNVRRPCPICGSTRDMKYISKNGGNKPHPVSLRPGIYGSFRHQSPFSEDKLPTLLFLGKSKLDRICNDCDNRISSEMALNSDLTGLGTDVHIGVVGHRSSGKSYLLYGGLGLLQQLYPDRFNQIDKNNETDIAAKKARIDLKLGIQTNVEDWYRATQLIYKAPGRLMPYHLFFYDVAGEKFDSNKRNKQTGLDFYRNVQSIMFVIDVEALDLSGIPASEEIVEWIKNQNTDEKYDIINTLSVIVDIFKNQVGRKTKDIDFNIVCVKKDKGYFESVGLNSDNIEAKGIENFIRNKLGLNNLVASAKVEFKTVNFHATSVVSTSKESLEQLYHNVLKQKGIKI